MRSTLLLILTICLLVLSACNQTPPPQERQAPPDIKKIKKDAYDSALKDIIAAIVDSSLNKQGIRHYTGEAHYHNTQANNYMAAESNKDLLKLNKSLSIETGTLRICEDNTTGHQVIGYIPYINNTNLDITRVPGPPDDHYQKHIGGRRVLVIPRNKQGRPFVTSNGKDTVKIQVMFDLVGRPFNKDHTHPHAH